MITIRVSSQGLTRCPSCQAHVRVAASAGATECPFCSATLGAELRRTPEGPSLVTGLASAGRSGALAAALLGSAVACGSDPEPLPDTGSDTAADVTSDADAIDAEDAPDVVPSDVYGVPADVTTDVAPDVPPAPEYGVPPDVGPDEDIETDPAPDATPAPEYGGPPDAD